MDGIIKFIREFYRITCHATRCCMLEKINKHKPRGGKFMKDLKQKVIVIAVAMAGLLPVCLSAQSIENARPVTDARLQNPEPENWLMFRRSYDGWGYSPLAKITRENVNRLKPVWTLSTGVTEGHQSPPIVNDGIMYITTPL